MRSLTRTGPLGSLLVAAVFLGSVHGDSAAAEIHDVGRSGVGFVVDNGRSAPVYSYANAVRESVWVDLGTAVGKPNGIDLDRDGHPDRIAADIIRPKEPAQQGLRVPVVMDVSPYYACCGRGNELQKKTYDTQSRPVGFPLFYDNFFVPRGYAVVLVDMAGTGRSTGCGDSGGPVDIGSGMAVVRWLSGRASGYTAAIGGRPVTAAWATGDVGVIGKSNDGAEAIGMAATGDHHVKTIVPIAGLGSQYTFNNQQGSWSGYHLYDPTSKPPDPGSQDAKCVPFTRALDAQAGTTGDYTRFWRERDYSAHVRPGDPPVLAVQGWGDRNVDPIQFGDWWKALESAQVIRHAWLHTGGHLDPFDLQRGKWVDTLHRWMDRWLLGIHNGIEREPAIHREVTPDVFVDEPRWPASGSTARWSLTASSTPEVGSLVRQTRTSATPASPLDAGDSATLTDNSELLADDAWPQHPNQPESYRLAYTTPALPAAFRVSGSGTVTVRVAADTPIARVGVELVDYGPAKVRDVVFPEQGITTTTTLSCWGASAPGDSSCYLETATKVADVPLQVLARGVADIGHARSLRHGVQLIPGRFFTVVVKFSAIDHVVPAGHRVGLIIGGTDAFLFAPKIEGTPEPTLTVDLSRTFLQLPLAFPR